MRMSERVITYDRPGYGGSDRFRGRRMVDCVADASEIADGLEPSTPAARTVSCLGARTIAE